MEAAILAVKNCANRFGFPYKIISDSGGGFRSTFIEQLRLLGVKHTHSSAYHPQSNSLAERAVQSLKGSLKKSPERVTKLHLDEMVLGINSSTSQEATGSANDRFMGRSICTLLPNSYNPELKTGELIEKQIANHEKRITKKNSNNKILYQIGDRVRLQNIVTKVIWHTYKS